MNTIQRKDIKELLASAGTHMKHGLGQHYLISPQGMHAFISHLPQTDEIIEIGPGIGNITINYFKNYKRVILIELDTEKIPILRDILTEYNDGVFPAWVEILQADILETNILTHLKNLASYAVIGALPYNISKKIITRTFELYPTPQKVVYILQREVADMYVQIPPNETFLSIYAKIFAHIERKEILKRGDFYPVPKVDSRVFIMTDFRAKSQEEIKSFFDFSSFIKQGYSQPRKKLSNVFDKNLFSQEVKLLLEKRAQELPEVLWKSLYEGKT